MTAKISAEEKVIIEYVENKKSVTRKLHGRLGIRKRPLVFNY